jgi:hypothetical protein
MTARCIPLGLVFLMATSTVGCGSQNISGSPEDGGGDTSDGADGSLPDELPDVPDDAPDAGVEPGLVPEGDPEYHDFPDHGRHPPFGQQIPVAFSGSVYEIVVGGSDGDELGVYRLLPGGTALGTTWYDEEALLSVRGTVCWSGEAFVAALPLVGEGIMVLGIGEDASLLHEPVVIPHEDEMEPYTSFIACPEDGPVFVASPSPPWATDGIRRLYHLDRDGLPTGTWYESDFPMSSLFPFFGDPVRLEWGDEFVVVAGNYDDATGLAFVSRDGSYRLSEPFDPPPYSESSGGLCCGLAMTDEGVATTWIKLNTDSKEYIVYSLVSTDGSILVPPVVTPCIVDWSFYFGIESASSGDTVLVAAGKPGDTDFNYPHLYLLDLDGGLLAPPVIPDPAWLETDPSYSYSPSHTALFWEGDAYSALWQEGSFVGYQRFTLVGID